LKLLFTFLAFFSAIQLFAQQNIADVRNSVGQDVTVSGIVTNGDELGLIRYFQDGTAGLAAYGSKLANVKRGDSILISGTLKDYNNLLEIDPIESVTIVSSGNKLPNPKIMTIDRIDEDFEGQLIQINNVEIENAIGTFDGNKNYNFTNGQEKGVFRTNNSSPIVGQVIPTGKINIVAICSQYSYYQNDTRSGYQLLPRTMEDFISGNLVNFTSPVEINNISKEGFILSWETDVEASSEVIFGFTSNQSSWTNFITGNSTLVNDRYFHDVNFSGLEAATIIYAKAFSVLNTDTTFSSIGVFATESNSSGEIKAYFNTPVQNSLSTGTEAMNIDNALEDTLMAYINRAEATIDFCIYNINNSGLSNMSQALIEAHNRGVKIRFITCGSTAHLGADNLLPEIPVLVSPDNSETGLMHNKFVSFDANSIDASKPWVWSGSTNLTEGQINSDANNMIFIQDQSLAKAYQIEFEEMWGSAGDQPNENTSKFGAAKTNNTPHEFIIGGNRVQLYFSPSDGTNQQIINAINTSDNDLNIETMLITRSDLAYSIKDAYERGVEVHVLTNASGGNSLTVNDILSNALPFGKYIFDNSASATLHHKLAIVDANYAASDPQVITGSHNWSNSANDRNDENTLIIHDAEIANQYFQQFAYRFAENGGDLVVSAENIEIENVKVYPNPTVEKITISSQIGIKNILLYSATGVQIKKINSCNSNQCEIDFTTFKSGLYILKIQTKNNKFNTYKIIKK